MSMTRDALVTDLVDANCILAAKGIVDAFGHVSARLGSDRFLLSRNLAPGQVTADDVLEYDLDSEPTDENAPRSYLERFIHGEIYRLRPDVSAVVHSHSVSLIPFGVVPSVQLKPICHMAGFIDGSAPVFEIRDTGGACTDLLIRNRELGRSLAEKLGSSSVILMRGHGSTVVGPDIRRVVYRAIYADVNARLQLAASALGEPTFLNKMEAQAANETNEQQIDRPWNFWRHECGGQ
jgi:ribulose-5-phosphate 4-epimerase/fuculose-1-phosphate aldolase